MPTKTARTRLRLRCDDNSVLAAAGRDAAVVVSVATEGQEETGLVADRATGTGTSTEAGHAAEAEIVTVTATATTEGLGTAHSPAEDLAAGIAIVIAEDLAAEIATVTGAKAGDAGTASRANSLNRQGRPIRGPSFLYLDAREVSDVNH